MKQIFKKETVLIFLTMLLPLIEGCTSIAKQNIISNVNTGIGLTVAQNPQSQLYEVKVGYIRTQFYSIPTGKTFDDDGKPTSSHAERAPQLVAGIRMHSGVDNLIVGMDVSENFAVGDIAVRSDAATAMYIANAQSDKKAEAASKVVGQSFTPAVMNKMADISDLHQTGTAVQKQAIDDAVKGISGNDWPTFVRSAQPADWQQLTSILTTRGILKP